MMMHKEPYLPPSPRRDDLDNLIDHDQRTIRCHVCGEPFAPKRRSQVCCGPACKQAMYRQNRNAIRAENPISGHMHRSGKNSRKSSPQTIGNKRFPVTVFGNSEIGPLHFERVNAVTIKLTDGVKIRQPGSHGQWSGFDQNRPLAWLMEVGWLAGKPAWCARLGPMSYGPTSLAKAKAAATAMVLGWFDQPVQVVTDPVGNLHRMQATLVGDGGSVAVTFDTDDMRDTEGAELMGAGNLIEGEEA